ncbi:MAG: polysulfide reductase, NrfD [Mariprofundales bacterium]|nr:polysulfide reductase, NrfD [Mariprofundales bacterium]
MTFANWAILMDSYLFVLYLPLAGMFWCSVLHLSNAKWRFEVRYLMASASALFPLGLVLLLIILAAGPQCFPWMAGHTHGAPLNGWHNRTFFTLRELGLYLAVWAYCAYFIKLQKNEYPSAPPEQRRRFRNIALLGPVVYCIYGTIVAWDFEMTQWPRWWSPIYGPYHFESMMRMFLAFFILSLFVLRARGDLKRPTHDYVFNFCAQIMLALTIVWTYLFFMQYLVMWYGDLPDEIGRYNNMMNGPNWFIFWSFFFLNSFIPFLSLIFTSVRHSPAMMLFPAISILIGTFLERYMWIISPFAKDIDHTPLLSSWIDVAIVAVVFTVAVSLWDLKMKKNGLYEDHTTVTDGDATAKA